MMRAHRRTKRWHTEGRHLRIDEGWRRPTPLRTAATVLRRAMEDGVATEAARHLTLTRDRVVGNDGSDGDVLCCDCRVTVRSVPTPCCNGERIASQLTCSNPKCGAVERPSEDLIGEPCGTCLRGTWEAVPE